MMRSEKFSEKSLGSICELSQKRGRFLVERESSDKISAPFLYEDGCTPTVGSVYSEFSIDKFEYDHQTFDFVLDASIKAAEKYKEITVYACVCDESDPDIRYRTPEKTNYDTSSLSYHQEGNLKEALHSQAADETAVLVFADLTDEEGTHTHAVKLEYEAGINLIHKVEHPKRQTGYIKFGDGTDPLNPVELDQMTDADSTLTEKKDGIVTIALFREPERAALADLDYLCNFGKCDPNKGNHPKLGVPIKGTLKIEGASEIISSGSLKPSILCTLSKIDSDGVLVAASSDYDTSVGCDVNGDTLIYDLTKNSWHEIYMEPGLFDQKKYVYSISFDIYYKLNGGDTLHLNRRYSSGDIINENSDEKLAYLVIEWGCLEENTQIMMADGSMRKIKDIQRCDRVMSAGGKAVTVQNTWIGMESHCFKLTTEGGNVITATYNHPFLTTDGWKRSSDIQVGDKLLDKEGIPVCVINTEELNREIKVYNLEFDSPNVIIANGLQTGDFSVQNGMLPE